MSKRFLFNFILALTGVAVAVFWLLSMFEIEAFKDFNILWVAAILSGVAGALFVLKGVLTKDISVFKKLNIIFGAGLLVLTLLAIVKIYAIEDKFVLPIIAIIGTAALLLCVIAVGGKKWDTGDNQKVGYKNYYQRKEEEERKNKDK